MSSPGLSPRRIAGPLAAALLLLVTAGSAQEIPPDPVLQGFAPTGDYELHLDGRRVPDAELFRSQRAGQAMLILAPTLPDGLLVSPRERQVSSIEKAKIVRRADGTLDVLSDASQTTVGPFTVEGREVHFSVAGREARLAERPYLLGNHDTRGMLEYSPEYVHLASQYKPSEPMLRALRDISQPVTVRVYFGTWCPACRDMVPRILRVAEELEGTPIAFEYYGLPTPFGNEPEARRAGISAVPTAVVYRAGREVGRLEGGDWRVPELALRRVLAGS
jgi:thiol-disulfide isomerase/thioredoxin